ncbi:MAG: MATE family efflux transporter [Oscillospiraceae bacterium]|nr:MATE family efflux transporter [Oscillospiraceae bacterium]
MSETERKENTLQDDVLKKSVFSLAIPIFFQMLLGIALGYVDTIMLSNYSDTSVGAIGNANSIIGFLALAFTVISSATGIMVSQYLGAGKREELNKVYSVAMSFNLVLSVAISLCVFFFSTPLLNVMQVPQEMMSDADRYMKIVGGTIFTQAIINNFSQIYNSNGKTQFGMFVAIGMNIVNIFSNYLLLYGPLQSLGLGASGVAVSTSISRILAVIIGFLYFKRVIKGNLNLKYLVPFPKEILNSLLRLGIPTAGENVSYNLSQLVIGAIVNTMGLVAINARIYAVMLSMFTYMIAFAAAMATQIQVGHSVGAGDYNFAYKRVLKTLRFGLIVSISIGIVNFLLSPYTFRIFTNDKNVAALGTVIMLISVILELGRTPNIIIINSMKAAGDVKFPTILAIFSMWLLSALMSYILGVVLGMGLAGVWIAMAADEIFRGIVVFIRWIRGTWKGKKVVS